MSKAAIISAIKSNHDFMKNLVHATFVAEGKKGLKIVPCENHPIEKIPSLYGKKLIIENIKPDDLISVINGCGNILKAAITETANELEQITNETTNISCSTYEQLHILKNQIFQTVEHAAKKQAA
jgi:hypothetical protein